VKSGQRLGTIAGDEKTTWINYKYHNIDKFVSDFINDYSNSELTLKERNLTHSLVILVGELIIHLNYKILFLSIKGHFIGKAVDLLVEIGVEDFGMDCGIAQGKGKIYDFAFIVVISRTINSVYLTKYLCFRLAKEIEMGKFDEEPELGVFL
ncbi:hypothetical protein ACJX0J_020784, partial [Zea mays]